MYLVTDAEVVIGGILIVFAGMVAIVGLLYLISGVIKFGASAGAKKKDKNNEIKGAVEIAETAAEDTENVSDDELIAVISAAVAVYMGSDENAPRFRVTSFKRVAPQSRRN